MDPRLFEWAQRRQKVKQKGWTVDKDRWQRRISNSEDSSDPARARGDHMRIVSTSRAGAALPLFGKR